MLPPQHSGLFLRIVSMILRALTLVLICGLVAAGQENPKSKHKAACPTDCEPCTKAIAKALDYLAGSRPLR